MANAPEPKVYLHWENPVTHDHNYAMAPINGFVNGFRVRSLNESESKTVFDPLKHDHSSCRKKRLSSPPTPKPESHGHTLCWRVYDAALYCHSMVDLPVEAPQKKPPLIARLWWNNFTTLRKWAEDFYPLEEVLKFKPAQAKLANWLINELENPSAILPSVSGRERKFATSQIQNWLSVLYNNLTSYPFWVQQSEVLLIEQMTQFASGINKELFDPNMKNLERYAPEVHAAFSDKYKHRQWQKKLEENYSPKQIKQISGRIKRLFSYSNLPFLKESGEPSEPVSFENPKKVLKTTTPQPTKMTWVSDKEELFFSALGLQLKRPLINPESMDTSKNS